MTMRMLGVIAAMALSYACGSSSTPNDGSVTDSSTDGGDPTAACTMLATARCAKVDSCSNGTGIARSYGTMTACVSGLTANCLQGLAAPNTTATPAFEIACGTAYAAQSCADFRNNLTPDACVAPAGTLANGMPCVTSAQCQSTVCLTPRTSLCGTCAAQPAEGSDCSANSGCGRNMVCNHNATTGAYTCRVAGQTGSTCDTDHPCAVDLGCVVAAAGAASGTCQPVGSTVGAMCNGANVGMPNCAANLDLFCDATHLCSLATLGAAGDACASDVTHTMYVFCGAGGFCTPSVAGSTRMCLAAGTEGQPCDTVSGPGCLSPARCVLTNPVGADAGTGGTCHAISATACTH